MLIILSAVLIFPAVLLPDVFNYTAEVSIKDCYLYTTDAGGP
ncbi:hypothetical protein BH10BAC5_BH10BAC5_29380 [soil metagenome]